MQHLAMEPSMNEPPAMSLSSGVATLRAVTREPALFHGADERTRHQQAHSGDSSCCGYSVARTSTCARRPHFNRAAQPSHGEHCTRHAAKPARLPCQAALACTPIGCAEWPQPLSPTPRLLLSCGGVAKLELPRFRRHLDASGRKPEKV